MIITTKTYHNGSFFSYKKQHFYRSIQPATATRHEKTFNNDMRDTKRFLCTGWKKHPSKVVNTWTFDRLTPNGNEGVGVKLDYLEHTYGTRYYVINKVNGDINAIHDQSLELTEFKGCFSPFNLDDLEARVCRLANRAGDIEDTVAQQNAPHTCFTDPRTLNMKHTKVWGSTKTITARYRQSVENHQKESLQDLHQHWNLKMNLSWTGQTQLTTGVR